MRMRLWRRVESGSGIHDPDHSISERGDRFYNKAASGLCFTQLTACRNWEYQRTYASHSHHLVGKCIPLPYPGLNE